MRIFFDTEFTGLTLDAKLISLGLVDESGLNEFYDVVTDCSDFCQQEVLPHLEGGAAQMTLAELQVTLATWLHARGPGAVLVCDSPRDIVQLKTVLPHGLPANVTLHVLGRWGNLKRRVFNFGRRIHREHGYRVHHALDDAKVNRLVLTR